MLKPFSIAVSAVVLMVSVILLYWHTRDEPVEPLTAFNAQQDVVDVGKTTREELSSEAVQRFEKYAQEGERLGGRVASLRGTQVDGRLRLDANGDLLITPDIRLMFDYFLSALGEEDMEQIKGRIAAYLSEQLPEGAAVQGWELFERYMALRDAMESIPAHDGSPASVRSAIRQRNAMQQSYLGVEMADAFYGLDIAYDNYMIERQSLMEDEGLTDDQRQRRLDALMQELPEPMQEMFVETRKPKMLEQQVQTLRESGASEAEVRALREVTFGVVAADRFERLEQQRSQWQKRYEDYRQQREVLLSSGGLAEADQERLLGDLRERLFSEQELARVRALDRIPTTNQ